MLFASRSTDASDTPYLDSSLPLEERVDDLLSRLTFDEKVALVHADSKFTSPGVPRLGIGPLWLSDGPHGIREEIGPHSWRSAAWTNDFATYLPVLTTLASTWNEALAAEHGTVIAEEALKRGKHVVLGPGFNIQRSPLNGRNFEYMGEDPYLIGRLAVSEIRAVQSLRVAANAKHFAVNNQEWERENVNVVVDERALREIYLPAFENAVKEGEVLTVMGAYNLFEGQHCCHNETLVNGILKGEWGFDGVYLSDWNGVHDTREAALFGMDLEMGTVADDYDDYYLAAPYAAGLKDGSFPMSTLDDKVRRNLRVMFATGLVDGRPEGSINTKEHQSVARRIAEEGIVLLKNSSAILPLSDNRITRIAVIGNAAIHKFGAAGWSSGIKALYEVTGLEGLTSRVGKKADVSFSAGYTIPHESIGGIADGAGVIRGGEEEILDTDLSALRQRATESAKLADVAIVFATLSHADNYGDCEGSDRADLNLPWEQNALIESVAAANPNVIVVLYCGSPVAMPWIDKVSAVVQAWYPGMEGGNAVARILFGDVNPSGKLPCTFPKQLADSPAHRSSDPRNWPGVKSEKKYYEVSYDEGIFVGYRWNDANDVDPLFPFGHGLSYTKFEYSNPRLTEQDGRVIVHCDIANVGDRAGKEIVQVYVSALQSSVPRPPQELKGFAKVALQPGESKTVAIELDKRAFAFWDVERHGWRAEAGTYELRISASSRDTRLTIPHSLPRTIDVD